MTGGAASGGLQSADTFVVAMRGKQSSSDAANAPSGDGSVLVEYSISVCGAYKVHVRGVDKYSENGRGDNGRGVPSAPAAPM